MTARVAARSAASAVLAAVAGLAALAGPAAVAVPLLSAAPAAAASAPAPVVVVVVPDLRWGDVTSMPALQHFAAHAAVGVLSVRAEGQSTRCGDGLLELSTGTRVPSGVQSCALGPHRLATLRAAYRHDRYGSQVGLLGDAVAPHAYAVDSAAATVLSGRSTAARRAPSVGAALRADPSAVVVAVDDRLYTDRDRVAGAAAVDRALAAQLAQVPPTAAVLVVGGSDAATGGPHLHPLFVSGPGWTHRALASASTGRAPYVQLFDVTATVLSLRHAALPTSVSGRAVHVTSAAVRRPAAYVDTDRHARRALTVGHPTFTAMCGVLIACLLLFAWRRPEAAWLARLLVFAPVAAWLVQLVPWWRWSVAAYAAVVAGIAVVGAVVVTVARLRSLALALVAGAAVTAGVLLVDQLAGAPLQLSAPFGDNPLVAGRFHGMGNIDFAVTMTSLLLCAAVLATRARRRSVAVATVAAIGVLAIVVDGAPGLGDDLGGVLALVPAVAVLAGLVAGVRVTWRRALVIAVGAVAVGVVVAVADYQRPAAHQTHAGRFVGQVLHGGAWRVVHRKLDAVLASFDNPVVTALVLVAVAVVLLGRRGRGMPRAVVVGGAAVAVLAVVGSLLNDSGLFVAAAAVLAFAPAAVALGRRSAPADDRSGTTAGDNRVL